MYLQSLVVRTAALSLGVVLVMPAALVMLRLSFQDYPLWTTTDQLTFGLCGSDQNNSYHIYLYYYFFLTRIMCRLFEKQFYLAEDALPKLNLLLSQHLFFAADMGTTADSEHVSMRES